MRLLSSSCKVVISLFLLSFLGATPTNALQTHAGPEGLYAHLEAHIFYLLAMVIFAIRIHRSKLWEEKGWQSIVRGLWLLAFWNVWAFIGHIITLYIPQGHMMTRDTDMAPVLIVNSFMDVIYYVLKMDHLICVPAVIFLFIGIKSMLLNHKPKNMPQER